MTLLWLGLLVLLLVVVYIFMWPLWQRKQNLLADLEQSRGSANVKLYQEHVRDLEASFSAGDIDEASYQNLLTELKRKLLADNAKQSNDTQRQSVTFGRVAIIASLVFCIVASLLFYVVRGHSADMHILNMQESYAKLDMQDMQNGQKPNAARTYELIGLIKQRLKAVPDKMEYWYLLSVYAMRVSDYPIAIEGYRAIHRINPSDANNTAALAQVLFLENGSQMSDEVVAMSAAALKVNPSESTALGLMGIDAFERKDYEAVIRYWSDAAIALEDGSPGKMALLSGVARAQQALGQPVTLQSEVSSITNANEAAAGLKIPVSVSLSPDITPISGTLFVYVRKWQSSPMPLLVTKINNYTFPTEVTLDESMAMIDASGIRTAGPLEVVARISSSGSAIPSPGDLEGYFGPFDSADIPKNMAVIINKTR